MSNFYDSGKFGVIQRQWFGLTSKCGGSGDVPFTFGTTDATSRTHVARWYPPMKGPIKVHKVGAMVLASVIAGSQDATDKIPVRFYTRGGSASNLGTFSLDINGGTMAPFTFASNESPAVSQCKAGEYITIKTGTPQTAKGTAKNTATTTGSVAFFLDWTPTFDVGGIWDVNQ